MSQKFTNPFVPGQIIDLEVTTLVSDGRGLGRVEGVVCLVEGAFPGQWVRARITDVRKSLVEGEIAELITPSPDERPSPCPHAGRCGGCAWQSLDYAQQLAWKERSVRDALERVGKVSTPSVLPILASPQEWGYRNKMEFACARGEDGKIVLGLRERGSRQIVEVTGCLLQSPLTMRVLSAMRELLRGDFSGLAARFLVVREPRAGGCFVELIVGPGSDAAMGEGLAKALRGVVSEVTGFALSVRTAPSDIAYGERTLYVDGQLEEQIGAVRLRLGHNAFFQVNTPAAELLYAEAARFADLGSFREPVLWDVYSGVGSIGFSLATPGTRIVAVEEMPGAVRCAKANATRLGVKPYQAESGDARSVLGRLLRLGPKPDVIVVDPPRSGMDAKVVQQLCEAAPKRLVYVSCNPATLARDVARLSDVFRLEGARPVDLFPQTPHVETVALLVRK